MNHYLRVVGICLGLVFSCPVVAGSGPVAGPLLPTLPGPGIAGGPPAFNPMQGPMGANGKPAALSTDDLKLLSEVEQEINKFVATLPADQQKQFWKDVDELTQVMSTMNEDELVKFVENVFQDETQPGGPVAGPPAKMGEPPLVTDRPLAPATPISPVEVAQEAKKSEPLATDKAQQEAVALINSIINKIENFLRKMQIMPDIAGKVESWGNERKLKQFKAGMTWQSVRVQIESFNYKLNMIKDRAIRTNQYKYIPDVAHDETLINNLNKLNTTLSAYEPIIEVSAFGVEKMNAKAREATRKVIDGLLEAMNVLAIPQALDKIVDKYDPIAKKLREAEEGFTRQAVERSRMPGYVAPAQVAGRPERLADFNLERASAAGRYADSTMPFYAPSYGPSGAPSFAPGSTLSTATGDKAKAAGAETKPPTTPATGKTEAAKKEEDKQAERLVTSLNEDFEEAIDALDQLRTINKYMLDATTPVNADIATSVKGAYDALARASKRLDVLYRRLQRLNSTQRTEYRKTINDAYKDIKEYVERVNTQIGALRANTNKIPLDKQYAFLKNETVAASDQAKKIVPSPVSLFELQDRIKRLKDAVARVNTAR